MKNIIIFLIIIISASLSYLDDYIKTEKYKYEYFEEFSHFGYGYTTSIAWGDFDNDGDIDLAVANENVDATGMVGWSNEFEYYNDIYANYVLMESQNKLFINEGNGIFKEYNNFGGKYDHTIAITTGDFNNDGLLDLAALKSFDFIKLDYLKEGGEENQVEIPGILEGYKPYFNTNLYIYYNKGNNNFLEKLILENVGKYYRFNRVKMYSIDINNDGHLDIITSNGFIFLNKGENIFIINRDLYDMEIKNVKVGFFNKDGYVDIIGIKSNKEIVIYKNKKCDFKENQKIKFEKTKIKPMYPFNYVLFDYNYDGNVDFAIKGEKSYYLFINSGNGKFKNNDEFDIYKKIDYDLDGKPDIKLKYLLDYNVSVGECNKIMNGYFYDFNNDGDIDCAIANKGIWPEGGPGDNGKNKILINMENRDTNEEIKNIIDSDLKMRIEICNKKLFYCWYLYSELNVEGKEFYKKMKVDYWPFIYEIYNYYKNKFNYENVEIEENILNEIYNSINVYIEHLLNSIKDNTEISKKDRLYSLYKINNELEEFYYKYGYEKKDLEIELKKEISYLENKIELNHKKELKEKREYLEKELTSLGWELKRKLKEAEVLEEEINWLYLNDLYKEASEKTTELRKLAEEVSEKGYNFSEFCREYLKLFGYDALYELANKNGFISIMK